MAHSCSRDALYSQYVVFRERDMKPIDFINAISLAACKNMTKTRIPASFTIAQAALESSWGGSKLLQDACNLFGVKADASWRGETISMKTGEHLNGKDVVVAASWRKYKNWQDCIDDHAKFLLQDRYKAAFDHCDDAYTFAKIIASRGYATDPLYANKIIAIIHSHNLLTFDRKG
jgi:flagellum-specific peptidoglycan hydrolase FlgJ